MIILFRSKIIVEIINRIHRLTVFMHFIMTMWTSTFSGTADISYYFTAFYFLSNLSFYSIHVTIQSFVTKTMIDHNIVSIAPGIILSFFYNTIGGCIDWCA